MKGKYDGERTRREVLNWEMNLAQNLSTTRKLKPQMNDDQQYEISKES